MCVCVCAHVISVAQCCPTLQPHGGCRGFQVTLSMGFSRQEYWSKLPFLIPGDLPNPGIEPASLESPALAGGFFTTRATWEAKSQNGWVQVSTLSLSSWTCYLTACDGLIMCPQRFNSPLIRIRVGTSLVIQWLRL